MISFKWTRLSLLILTIRSNDFLAGRYFVKLSINAATASWKRSSLSEQFGCNLPSSTTFRPGPLVTLASNLGFWWDGDNIWNIFNWLVKTKYHLQCDIHLHIIRVKPSWSFDVTVSSRYILCCHMIKKLKTNVEASPWNKLTKYVKNKPSVSVSCEAQISLTKVNNPHLPNHPSLLVNKRRKIQNCCSSFAVKSAANVAPLHWHWHLVVVSVERHIGLVNRTHHHLHHTTGFSDGLF